MMRSAVPWKTSDEDRVVGMSEAAKPAIKTKKFKPLGVKIRMATEQESDIPVPEEVSLTIAPSTEPVGKGVEGPGTLAVIDQVPETAARTFFKKPVIPVPGTKAPQAPRGAIIKRLDDLAPAVEKAEEAIPPPLEPKPVVAPSVKPSMPKATVPKATVPKATMPKTDVVIPTAAPEEPIDGKKDISMFDRTPFEELANAIREEETKSPYKTEIPDEGFMPQNRRGFSNFIKETYLQYALPPQPIEPDYDACLKLGASGAQTAEIYQYQQFVRDYMSWSTPYRGILVYHGLGSGKTCTAIAAAEALYATANRRIIVMTPFSLRKNFIREITFCGFRHFRLLNHWVPYPNDATKEPLVRLFASNVLNIPIQHLKKAKTIWIPDFTKAQNYQAPAGSSAEEKANYLSSQEQTEVREQIQATLIFDPNPKKPRHGRIWFINYNGITASKLKELACQKPPNAFDNAVIIVDEVHNLIRLMQGTIEPYLSDLKGVKRKISPEPVTWETWAPKLCGKSMNYKRGYLFYRMLSGARGSKIIGLSGTPLINFPEELAILTNILHGYLHIAEARVGISGGDAQKLKETIETVAQKNIFIDFYRVTIDDVGIKVVVTTLPEGIRKITDDIGVERIPFDESQVSFQERLESFKSDLEKAGIRLAAGMKIHSEPLLPPVGERFREVFLQQDGVTIKNRMLLIKRLTGLISYYKGSRRDLMPLVTKDEVVRVPFSIYQQSQYSKVRLEEIDIEKSKDKQKPAQQGIGAGRLGALWAEIYEIKSLKQSSNYRMGSRQACNFVFPPGISRPRPRSQLEASQEVGADPEDIIDSVPENTAVPGEPDDVSVILGEEEQIEGEAEKEDESVEKESEEAFLQDRRARLEEEGKTAAEIAEALEVARKEFREAGAAILVAQTEAPILEGLSDEEKRCRANYLPNETYLQAIKRSKECLLTIGRNKISLTNKEGLQELSPKYQTMIEKINAAKGSSLVYSQFLSMEGIGIFTIVLQANEFDPIIIDTSSGVAKFSPETEVSLRLGPAAKRGRFITFTGGESEEVRKYAVDIFNAKFSELPKAMADVLAESGYASNQQGELCRVFCITSAGAEGLSLKNVRAVHIMEPYWNDVRMAQVKGRAVRICSHMDIQPPSERTVEIFTYVTVFGPQAQVARTGDYRIAEEIVLRDSLSRKEALEAHLPIPEGASNYVLTSDERLLVISERKKQLITNLETIMKTSAVDCQLNFNENKDGTYTCSVFGKVGGFMYDPEFDVDLTETASKFPDKPLAPVAPMAPLPIVAAPVKSITERKVRETKIKGVTYLIEEIEDPSTKEIIRYDLYAADDKQLTKKIGTVKPKAKPTQ